MLTPEDNDVANILRHVLHLEEKLERPISVVLDGQPELYTSYRDRFRPVRFNYEEEIQKNLIPYEPESHLSDDANKFMEDQHNETKGYYLKIASFLRKIPEGTVFENVKTLEKAIRATEGDLPVRPEIPEDLLNHRGKFTPSEQERWDEYNRQSLAYQHKMIMSLFNYLRIDLATRDVSLSGGGSISVVHYIGKITFC